MGQCGQGHAQSPITRPKKVIGLEGVSVHQISAGTSHSFAWTTLPSERYYTSVGNNSQSIVRDLLKLSDKDSENFDLYSTIII